MSFSNPIYRIVVSYNLWALERTFGEGETKREVDVNICMWCD
jgi:hypothetical protein